MSVPNTMPLDGEHTMPRRPAALSPIAARMRAVNRRSRFQSSDAALANQTMFTEAGDSARASPSMIGSRTGPTNLRSASLSRASPSTLQSVRNQRQALQDGVDPLEISMSTVYFRALKRHRAVSPEPEWSDLKALPSRPHKVTAVCLRIALICSILQVIATCLIMITPYPSGVYLSILGTNLGLEFHAAASFVAMILSMLGVAVFSATLSITTAVVGGCLIVVALGVSAFGLKSVLSAFTASDPGRLMFMAASALAACSHAGSVTFIGLAAAAVRRSRAVFLNVS
eukprot:gnl/Dysnectes_brevis/1991_a2292_2147.p1 GENE.gnl/Dysnectes_brevis/1991_a2292_2147~~gnl/Dysnectes_brevis/1991_a2292_2147.p1  ORF type:complete len:285 (+),score=75.70 gnl/Dysnectes_brevis/1991_a2292_2147:32-886(+)